MTFSATVKGSRPAGAHGPSIERIPWTRKLTCSPCRKISPSSGTVEAGEGCSRACSYRRRSHRAARAPRRRPPRSRRRRSRDHEAIPGRARERPGRLRGDRGRGARAARRERRRKSTLSNILTGLYRPDEGEIFLHGERVDFHVPATRSTPGSAWCTSTSVSSSRSPSPRTSSSVTTAARAELRRRTIARSSAASASSASLRPARRPPRAHLAALARRAAARRDPEGPVSRGAHPDPGRADRRADAAGGGRPLRHAARDGQ